MSEQRNVLVTGAAGFIGMHVAARLLEGGSTVTGADNLDPYYDVALKEARLARLFAHSRFSFAHVDLADTEAALALFHDGAFTDVIHLAAQPGVRHSLTNPGAYIVNNLVAFGHVVEGCRHSHDRHLVYASSSSVYVASHDKAGERAHRPQLQPSLSAAGDSPALLHRLRSLGQARHGAHAVRQGDPRR